MHLLLFLSAHPSQPFPPRSLPKESPAPCPTEGGPCSACGSLSYQASGPQGLERDSVHGLVLWASVLFLPRGQLCYSGWAAPRRLRLTSPAKLKAAAQVRRESCELACTGTRSAPDAGLRLCRESFVFSVLEPVRLSICPSASSSLWGPSLGVPLFISED